MVQGQKLINSTVERLLDKWLSEKQVELVANYKRLGLRASGRWEQSLVHNVDTQGSKTTGTITGEDYTEYMENGRRPNRDQSKKAIRGFVGWAGSTFIKKWLEDKGLLANPYAVAYKIATKGIKVPNLYNKGGLVSNVLTRAALDELRAQLSGAAAINITSEIRKLL
jgi:hypothetical protein